MRVRLFELRLLAAALTVLWAIGGGLVLLGYRPGGPLDIAVGVTAAIPVVVAGAALAWPPVARGRGAFVSIAWLAIAAIVLLVPAIGSVVTQIVRRGPQTLLPSAEAIYPWVLALLTTSLFTGLGVGRRVLGETALRRRRLVLGVVIATILTACTTVLFGSAAVANEAAIRDRPAGSSRFGPTDSAVEPPDCDAPIRVGTTARIEMTLEGEVDLRPIGGAQLSGQRSGDDFRWSANVATDRALGTFGAARAADRAWTRTPRRGWTPTDAASLDEAALDARILAVALGAGVRAAAEDFGLEFIEGARARHCRIAVDGDTFRSTFPQVRWLVGEEPMHRWRGQLDYWVFGDGQVGQVFGMINGEAGGIAPGKIQATVRTRLTATDRGSPVTVSPPVP